MIFAPFHAGPTSAKMCSKTRSGKYLKLSIRGNEALMLGSIVFGVDVLFERLFSFENTA